MRVLVVLALTLLLVGWVPLPDPPAEPRLCADWLVDRAEVAGITTGTVATVACYDVDLTPFETLLELEQRVLIAGGVWLEPWRPAVDRVSRALHLGEQTIGLTLVPAGRRTHLIVLILQEAPP